MDNTFLSIFESGDNIGSLWIGYPGTLFLNLFYYVSIFGFYLKTLI